MLEIYNAPRNIP